jgi:pimeloyl-ACP methyl ester carboxylesterase
LRPPACGADLPLKRRGRRAHVPSMHCVSRGAPPYWPAGVDAIVRAAGAEPVVLVPHSNSGLYVPAVIDALGDQVRGVVFVDAAFPGAGYFAQRDFLNTLAGADGLLPPWTSWWEQSDVAELFPNAELRARVEAEQARMPLADRARSGQPSAHAGRSGRCRRRGARDDRPLALSISTRSRRAEPRVTSASVRNLGPRFLACEAPCAAERERSICSRCRCSPRRAYRGLFVVKRRGGVFSVVGVWACSAGSS